ncbi:MAG: GGDEF domain-containing protein [Gammaproteobacteria bacterium]
MAVNINRPAQIDPSGRDKLLRMIDALRATPSGTLVYRQVESMLDAIAGNHLRVEMAYAGFVNILLDSYAGHLQAGSAPYVQIKLLQARLQPPLTPAELETVSEFVSTSAEAIRDSADLDLSIQHAAISPLLAAFGIDAVPAATQPLAVPPQAKTQSALRAAEGTTATAEVEEVLEEIRRQAEEPADDLPVSSEEATSADNGEFPTAPELPNDVPAELDNQREDMQKLQTTLGQQVLETITQNEEFGVILEGVLSDMRQSEELTDLENLRWTLIREVEKLMKGHNELADKLDSTYHYLQVIESDSRELSDELTRVRQLSLTDELTGLANRRAFMRRMEDEVARVQRYGFPLSFVLMDLDHFKAVNDEFGHAAGDEVLRVYSRNILTIFRHHDMVSRYGGEEFAVLLPNTDSDGAVRALNKVRRRVTETRWQTNGTMSQVPTFSAGVSLYKPGESANAFIERADKALYRAKRLGRNRIELDMTYQNEEGAGLPRRRSTD